MCSGRIKSVDFDDYFFDNSQLINIDHQPSSSINSFDTNLLETYNISEFTNENGKAMGSNINEINNKLLLIAKLQELNFEQDDVDRILSAGLSELDIEKIERESIKQRGNFTDSEMGRIEETGLTDEDIIQIVQKDLADLGFFKEDVDKLIAGDITFDELVTQIQKDSTDARFVSIQTASVLHMLGCEYSNTEEIEQAISEYEQQRSNAKLELANLIKEHNYTETDEIKSKKLEIDRFDIAINSLKQTKEYAEQEAISYINNCLKYLEKEDFNEKTSLASESYEGIIQNISKKTNAREHYTNLIGSPSDIETEALVKAFINDSALVEYTGVDSDLIKINVSDEDYKFVSIDNSFLRDVAAYSSVMKKEEKAIFNYIYNTAGYEEARKYLENMGKVLDERWLRYQSEKDSSFAEKNPIAASLLSIPLKPIGGIRSFINATNKMILSEHISYLDVYNTSSIYRGAVEKSIDPNPLNHFGYNAAMALGDVALLLPTIATTGTVGLIADAAYFGMMVGSPAFQDSINYRLQSGLYTDSEAYYSALLSGALATTASTISVSHLKGPHTFATNKIEAIANKFEDERIKKSIWVLGVATEQGMFAGGVSGTTAILDDFSAYLINHQTEYNYKIDKKILSGMTQDEAIITTLSEEMRGISSSALTAFALNFVVAVPFMSHRIIKADNFFGNEYGQLESKKNNIEDFDAGKQPQNSNSNGGATVVLNSPEGRMDYMRGGMNTFVYKYAKEIVKDELAEE